MATGLHLSLSAETLFSIGEFHVTNSIATSLIVSGLLIAFACIVRSKLTNTSRPSGIQNVAEFLVENLYAFVNTTTNDFKKSQKFFPFIATFFLFIVLNNWFGLLPGVGSIGFKKLEEKAPLESVAQPASQPEIISETPKETAVIVDDHASETSEEKQVAAEQTEKSEIEESGAQETGAHAETTFVPLLRAGTADLNTTAALAIISIIMTQIFGFTYLNAGYLTKYLNFESPIMFFVGLLELISEFSKILSFAFRLFGNIFAGEVLLAVIGVLAPAIVPMPFYGLELFVGFIQALVFSLLSLVFFNMATQGHKAH